MMKYKQTFRVSGRMEFPIDMLRYDACWPVTEMDSGKIAASLRHEEPGRAWEVELMRYVESRHDSPTFGRWDSFGASVIETSFRTERL